MGVPSRTSAPTPALDQTFDIQIILGKVRPFLRRLAEAHPQVLIIAPVHVTIDTMIDRAVAHGLHRDSAQLILNDILADYTGDELEYQLTSLDYATNEEAYHYTHLDPARPDVDQWVEGPYGPIALTLLTHDLPGDSSCYRCLHKGHTTHGHAGDLIQNNGDHWLCRNCAR